MALSVVDLYRDILPKTNCGDCGYPTCMAFDTEVKLMFDATITEHLDIESIMF